MLLYVHRNQRMVQCCFTSTETIRLIKPRTATSTFTQLLNSDVISNSKHSSNYNADSFLLRVYACSCACAEQSALHVTIHFKYSRSASGHFKLSFGSSGEADAERPRNLWHKGREMLITSCTAKVLCYFHEVSNHRGFWSPWRIVSDVRVFLPPPPPPPPFLLLLCFCVFVCCCCFVWFFFL